MSTITVQLPSTVHIGTVLLWKIQGWAKVGLELWVHKTQSLFLYYYYYYYYLFIYYWIIIIIIIIIIIVIIIIEFLTSQL
jgi:hypothetical protein